MCSWNKQLPNVRCGVDIRDCRRRRRRGGGHVASGSDICPLPTLPSYTRLRAVAELLQLQALKPTNICHITSYSIRPHDYDVGLFGFVFRVFKFY